MAQTPTNVVAAFKRETTYGTAETGGAGAEQIRIIDSPGLSMTRENIVSAERRSDQLQHMGRLGTKRVEGSYSMEINPGGAFDMLLEDLVRGTIGAPGTVADVSPGGGAGTQVALIETPAVPVYRGLTIEQYDVDIDASELFIGCRVTGARFQLQPNQMAQAEFMFMGLDRQVIAPASAPYFTDPSVTDGEPLVADDAVITYAGSAISTLTGLNFSVDINAAMQPVIGSIVSPDIYMNMLSVSGEITALREDLDALTAYDAETEFEILATLTAPGSDPKLTFAVRFPRVKINAASAPFSQGDTAKIETRSFTAHPEVGLSNAVQFYTSTATPVATA